MLKSIVRGAALTGVLLATAAGAAATPWGDETMYYRTYYDDAAMTQPVGSDQDVCTGNGLWSTPVQGRYGSYVQSEAFATCRDGQTIYF